MTGSGRKPEEPDRADRAPALNVDPGAVAWNGVLVTAAGLQAGVSPLIGAWTGREFLFPGSAGLVAFVPGG